MCRDVISSVKADEIRKLRANIEPKSIYLYTASAGLFQAVHHCINGPTLILLTTA